jgi:hypothetical protein
MRRLAAVAVAIVALCAAALVACGGDQADGRGVEISGKGCDDAGRTPGIEPYSLGATFAGLPLETVLLQCRGVRGDSIAYMYGDCEPPAGEGGCAPPVQVQIWRACERGYRSTEGERPTLRRQRGVPTARFDGHTEVYTDSTVVIFTADAALGRRAVDALRPMPRTGDSSRLPAGRPSASDLPQPPRGALAGTLSCA